MTTYYEDYLRAKVLLVDELIALSERMKNHREVRAAIKLTDSSTEYAKRSAFSQVVEELLEDNDIDLVVGVQVTLEYNPAYLVEVAVARGWVRK